MATNNSINVATGATNTVLAGQGVGVAPAFDATPIVTSISFGGTAMSTFVESTWTPNLQINGVNTGITYSNRAGWYTRINNLVFVMIRILLSSKGASVGDVTISNMPVSYGAAGGNQSFSIAQCGGITAAGFTTLSVTGVASSTVGLFKLSSISAGGSSSDLQNSNISNTFAITSFGMYYVF